MSIQRLIGFSLAPFPARIRLQRRGSESLALAAPDGLAAAGFFKHRLGGGAAEILDTAVLILTTAFVIRYGEYSAAQLARLLRVTRYAFQAVDLRLAIATVLYK